MPFNMHVNATRVLTEHDSPAFLCAVVRLLVERRRRDLLLRLAKSRSGDTTRWNLPLPSTRSSCSSSCLSSEKPHTRSKAPCKERRTLPTQPATCSWAAESFPPKYCMVKKLTRVVSEAPGSPLEPTRWTNCFVFLFEWKGFCGWGRKLGQCSHFQEVKKTITLLYKSKSDTSDFSF